MTEAASAQQRAWALLLFTRARLVERIEALLVASELPPLAWYDLLWALEQAGARLRMNALSERLVVSRSNLTRLVDRMHAAGLVERESCEDDRRGWYCVLTPEGRAMRRRMWPVYRDAIETLFAAEVRDTEAKTMARALERVLRRARLPTA